MKIEGQHRRAIEALSDRRAVRIVDQTVLPHQLTWLTLASLAEAANAIKGMQVRGAPLIGATAAYGYALAMSEDPSDVGLDAAYQTLFATRPTAVNLRWALDRVRAVLQALEPGQRADAAWQEAGQIAEQDVKTNAAIGGHGQRVCREVFADKQGGDTLNVLTHCNAGWLACVDWGTAISPIYQAYEGGMKVQVWVCETRPRGQGASLTAWELKQHGIPHTLIVDNEAGHLVQRGMVDLCIVGADRVAANGDVANKIGTYLKALVCKTHHVPFYVALPTSTIDWTIRNGIKDIPIEQRSGREVTHVTGLNAKGVREEVLICPEGTEARNDGFDVTPGRLITELITEYGTFSTNATDMRRLRLAAGL